MRVYNASIAKKISKSFPCKGNLLEYGAGIGTLATLFEAREGLKPKCLEINPDLKRVLVERGFKCYDNIEQIDVVCWLSRTNHLRYPRYYLGSFRKCNDNSWSHESVNRIKRALNALPWRPHT